MMEAWYIEMTNKLPPIEAEFKSGVAYRLPIASPETLGGVRPAAKTDEMTQLVGVDSDGVLWARPGGGVVDLSGYAQKSELPTKVSQLENDKGYLTQHQDISGKLDSSELPTAINTALAQAKASGEFDGNKGEQGPSGKNGIGIISIRIEEVK